MKELLNKILTNEMQPNWKELGFLEGLSIEQGEQLILLFNKTVDDVRKVYTKHDKTDSLVFPCIRRIYSLINCETDSMNYHIRKNTEIKNDINKLINLTDIIKKIDNLYPITLITQQYLQNVDAEAELISLFCEDYVNGLVKEFKNNK